MTDKKFLTPRQLTERWGGEIHERTLANWRASSRGPRYLRIGGKILYDLAEVEEYERRHTAQGTVEYAKWRGRD
ncbi:DNA-binding protein [Microvirga terrae]|uniref:DNA-binding protein n=1 Tax=Microvirga terrae TaxID=2740529 RepID=A0ABY5RVU9_9HYPH|nr:DNA-binding protein [Microvirga terrae]UVF21370.1 DNA-binding protein [Microvirga terrae]